MTIDNIMTRNLREVDSSATLTEAAALMDKFAVGCLIVMESGRVVGVVTDRDIVIRGVKNGHNPDEITVRQIMTPSCQSCSTCDDLETACQRMKEQRVRRLVVQDSENHPVGIVSVGDIASRGHARELAGDVMEEICVGASD